MGGQQVHESLWSEKLFSAEKLQSQKTQDEKLRELQTEFKDFCNKIENKIGELSNELKVCNEERQALAKRLDSMDNVVWYCRNVIDGMKKSQNSASCHEDTGCKGVNGWYTHVDLTERINDMIDKKEVNIEKKFLIGNRSPNTISAIYRQLGFLVFTNTSTKSCSLPTEYGIANGYVKSVCKSKNSKPSEILYNLDKAINVLTDYCNNPAKTISEIWADISKNGN